MYKFFRSSASADGAEAESTITTPNANKIKTTTHNIKSNGPFIKLDTFFTFFGICTS